MKKFETLKDVDATTDEGKMLIMAIAVLTSLGGYKKMHPDEVVQELAKKAEDVYYTEGGQEAK